MSQEDTVFKFAWQSVQSFNRKIDIDSIALKNKSITVQVEFGIEIQLKCAREMSQTHIDNPKIV